MKIKQLLWEDQLCALSGFEALEPYFCEDEFAGFSQTSWFGRGTINQIIGVRYWKHRFGSKEPHLQFICQLL